MHFPATIAGMAQHDYASKDSIGQGVCCWIKNLWREIRFGSQIITLPLTYGATRKMIVRSASPNFTTIGLSS
jgi:hypothetical protein